MNQTQSITVKSLKIGEGRTKVIIPLIESTEVGILSAVTALNQVEFDCLEWRVDHFEGVDDIDETIKLAEKIRASLPNKPILFTFRTVNEGGTRPYSDERYTQLNSTAAKSGFVDLIDLEIDSDENVIKKVIDCAHQADIKVVASHHNFNLTPNKAFMIEKLSKMDRLGADILKIAVMPQSARDLLTLLDATLEMKEQHTTKPLITMSMSKLGVMSRISGSVFGSSMTFGALTQTSAPGQLNVSDLKEILSKIE